MLKVNFKKDFKKVRACGINNKVTIVTLTGQIKEPFYYQVIPGHILDWAERHSLVAFDAMSGFGTIRIAASGKATCHEDDPYDCIVGERIAEARAKLRIYRFMYTLCKKLMEYYSTLMFGNAKIGKITESHDASPQDCIWLACNRYKGLMIRESHHLGQLLEEA